MISFSAGLGSIRMQISPGCAGDAIVGLMLINASQWLWFPCAVAVSGCRSPCNTLNTPLANRRALATLEGAGWGVMVKQHLRTQLYLCYSLPLLFLFMS